VLDGRDVLLLDPDLVRTAVHHGAHSPDSARPRPGETSGQDRTMTSRRCPCGSGLPLGECCGRLHDGSAAAATAEQLMRSRYSAFALGVPGYLLETWHPTTRPRTLTLDPEVRWTGLDVLATAGGGPLTSAGTVEFRAHYVADRTAGVQHERSRFVRDDGRWRYLDGVSLT
jgi:SEC-C motif domain protein